MLASVQADGCSVYFYLKKKLYAGIPLTGEISSIASGTHNRVLDGSSRH
jgi:hypothetical protein